MRDEVEYFNRSVKTPKKPFLAIFGGAKVSTKIAAIKNVGQVADAVIVGGAMANTFFLAMGYPVGYFEENFGALAGQPFDEPDDPPPQAREDW